MFKGSIFIDSKMTTINNSKSKFIAQVLEKEYQDKKIFCLDAWSDIAPASLPYLKTIKIFDVNNNNRKTFQSMRRQIDFNVKKFDVDNFSNYVDENSILITTGVFFEHEKNNPDLILDKKRNAIIFKGDKHIIEFIPFKKYEDINLDSYLIKVK
jgi:hypothetical protein